eukprot:3819761-Prymnesium_polylepis.2
MDEKPAGARATVERTTDCAAGASSGIATDRLSSERCDSSESIRASSERSASTSERSCTDMTSDTVATTLMATKPTVITFRQALSCHTAFGGDFVLSEGFSILTAISLVDVIVLRRRQSTPEGSSVCELGATSQHESARHVNEQEERGESEHDV